ncbi:MAG: Holliday junction branch migration DNA helicase RuvB [Leptolyngbya sp. PLA3]|nr:MAG: Holliday junction branch migration DNA helicase RuvB [Cyanobacteria bacterium CYA]MCE7969081.1 Holliday junction branch migration DNA helicase RuvB [Leptolyngbya sp. PL-A3]
MATDRIISAQANSNPEDERINWSLRPERIDEYVGQTDLIERLRIAIEAVRRRKEPLDHVLLHGPPGLGKTTLAHVIAHELGSRVHATSGPALARGTDLVAALTRLEKGDVLFIDEIHRLPVAVEEFIYPAMEDFRIDICLDSGLNARTVQINCQPFTLIGATTRAGLISSPLRSRFGIAHHIRYYDVEDLLVILRRSAALLGVSADGEALRIIAERARGTPRIANRLLRRVRDFAQVRADGNVAPRVVDAALHLEGVDALGLDELDRAYMRIIATTYRGGPVGLETVAATMNEDAGTLEDVVEPYLLQIGFLSRTRRGRALTGAGAGHIGARLPERPDDPTSLFNG